MKSLLVAALLALGATAAPSDFQGVIDMDIALSAGKGQLQLKVGEPATRIDMSLEIKPLPQPLRFALLLKNDNMKTLYMISDHTRSYSEIDISDKVAGNEEKGGPYVIKVVGNEKRLGYNTTVVEMTRPGEQVKLWVSKDIGIYSIFKRLQAANPQLGGQAEILSALEKAGHAGFPMKSVITQDGETVTLEVKKVEKKKIPVSEVSLPAGYTQAAISPGASGAGMPKVSPEQLEAMQKMLEDVLKGQQ